MPVSSAFGIRVLLAMITPLVACSRHRDTGHESDVTPEPLHAPTIQVQRHHRLPRLPDVPCLVLGLEGAGELQGDDLLREDPPRRVLAEPSARADVDDVGDLVVVEPGVLGLELHDHAPNERLQAPAPGPPNLALLIERGQQAAPYALPGAVLLPCP